MSRDKALEDLARKSIGAETGLVEKTMFGGLAFMLDGHLLCCARGDGLLFRIGRENESWALAMPGLSRMMSGKRPMLGWVRAAPEVARDAWARAKLVKAAREFVATLPARS